MNEARQSFFARAALAGDEHGPIDACHTLRNGDEASHRRTADTDIKVVIGASPS